MGVEGEKKGDEGAIMQIKDSSHKFSKFPEKYKKYLQEHKTNLHRQILDKRKLCRKKAQRRNFQMQTPTKSYR